MCTCVSLRLPCLHGAAAAAAVSAAAAAVAVVVATHLAAFEGRNSGRPGLGAAREAVLRTIVQGRITS